MVAFVEVDLIIMNELYEEWHKIKEVNEEKTSDTREWKNKSCPDYT
jgi:hypothetical protein